MLQNITRKSFNTHLIATFIAITAANEFGKNIHELYKKTNQITLWYNNVIPKQIVCQTNPLALNATIEGARYENIDTEFVIVTYDISTMVPLFYMTESVDRNVQQAKRSTHGKSEVKA